MDLYASSTAAFSTAASSTAASSAASTAAATAASTVASTAASSTAATALELDYHLYHDTVTKKWMATYQGQSKEFRDAQWAGVHKAEAAAKRWLHKMKSSTTAG